MEEAAEHSRTGREGSVPWAPWRGVVTWAAGVRRVF